MKKWLSASLLFTLFNLNLFAGQFYYVDVPLSSKEQLGTLRMRGLDIAGINLENQTISIVMEESEIGRSANLNIISMREVGRPDQQYKNPEELEQILVETEKNYPHLVRRESIGKSVEGRDIWAVSVTNRYSKTREPKKTILIDSMHHARELMTTEVALDVMDYLTKNHDSDTTVKNWLDKYEVWIVPMLNPDGNQRVWNEDYMWRKNTQGGYGVDINRNYPYGWASCNGSSGSKSSDTYRGASAGSEPETQALMDLVRRIQPKFNLSYHSYSELVIYPFGCSPQQVPSPDAQIYLETGKELAKRLVRDSGSGSYKAGTSYDLLYNVDGGSIDWMYGQEKVMSFVVELNGTWQGFQPSYQKWRDVTVERQRAGWKYLLEQMDAPGIK
jgi:hypothetical protein